MSHEEWIEEQIRQRGRELEILRIELANKRSQFDRLIQILVRIHSLCNPPLMHMQDGTTMQFQNAYANECLQQLSDAIREVPDIITREMAK